MYLELDHLRDLTLRAGQYKIPYSRQRVISSGKQQLVDRSLANGEFNQDRDIGLDLRSYDLFGLDGRLRYYAGVYMGEGRDFGSGNATADFALHYLGRLEVLPLGDFADYREADLERHPNPKLSLGAAYAYLDDAQRLRGVLGERPEDGGTTDYHSANVDYVFKWRGLSSSGELLWRRGRRNEGPQADGQAEAPRNGFGGFIQTGYLVPGMPLEVAVRYSGVRGLGAFRSGRLDGADLDGATALDRRDRVATGLSYYFAGHPLKLQADLSSTWREGSARQSERLGRLQLQLSL
ncbi:MAG: hypothetical protein AAGN82_13815 [Myxococcota bacterium]